MPMSTPSQPGPMARMNAPSAVTHRRPENRIVRSPTTLGSPTTNAMTTSGRTRAWTSTVNATPASNPTAVAEFRAAIKEADDWISANNPAAYQAIADYTKVPLSQAKESPLTVYTTDVSGADLKIWGDAMTKYAGFSKTVDYASLVYAGK